jgi:SAM-dependent MidA family methyltransferase
MEYSGFFAALREFGGPLTAVFFDYGITSDEWHAGVRPKGTLRGYRNHQVVDPLSLPGQTDITSDVHWDAVTVAAQDAGFTVSPLQSQGSFLMNHGILDELSELLAEQAGKPGTGLTAAKLKNSMNQLVLPGGMGERFSVLECRCLTTSSTGAN